MQDHSNSKYILLELHHFTMTLKVKCVSLTNMFLHNTVVAVFYTFDSEPGPSPGYAVCHDDLAPSRDLY